MTAIFVVLWLLQTVPLYLSTYPHTRRSRTTNHCTSLARTHTAASGPSSMHAFPVC